MAFMGLPSVFQEEGVGWMLRFFGKGRGKKEKPKDEVDLLIERIEKFAPEKHRHEREMYYYNYRIMHSYLKPLLALLTALCQKERLGGDQSAFAEDLFFLLKAFYDLKDRLSMEEALKDEGLMRKYRELFLYFYDKREMLPLNRERLLESYLRFK